MQPILEIQNLSFSYQGGIQALDQVTIGLERGEAAAVVGANGSGKSTLLLHAAALQTSDQVRIDGLRATDKRHLARIRQVVGILFQDPDDQLFMPTVVEDVAFGPIQFGTSPEKAHRLAAELLGSLGLAHLAQRPSHHLSGGEKRLAALAAVLAPGPQLLLLDEPTAGLDPKARRRLIQTLADLRAQGTTLLVATHDLDMAYELCPRTILLADGRVLADGPTKILLADESLMDQAGLEVCLSVRLAQATEN